MKKIGIIGSGLIGRSWAALFASAGYKVVMYDIDKNARDKSLSIIEEQLKDLERNGLRRGTLSVQEQRGLISTTGDFAEAVIGAKHVQECVYEDAELKRKVFRQMCEYCDDDEMVLSSSVSCIMPSVLFDGLPRVSQCIVAHPCNPPFLCPLTEIAAHPETSPDVVRKTRELMVEIGQTPVTVKKEIDGYVSNRIQYAIINECWRLVLGGYMSVEDVDKVMTDGIGMRYAFMGPFAVCHLNAERTKEYMEKYGGTIKRVSSTFGPVPEYDATSVDEINEEICKMMPFSRTTEGLEKLRSWRDNCLLELSRIKEKVKME